jgi:hypothetical protein
VVESSALLKRRSPKGYRGFESLPHRQLLLCDFAKGLARSSAFAERRFECPSTGGARYAQGLEAKLSLQSQSAALDNPSLAAASYLTPLSDRLCFSFVGRTVASRSNSEPKHSLHEGAAALIFPP